MRFILALLIQVLLLNLVDGKTISLWENYNDEEHEIFMKLVKKYEQATGIRIEVQRVPFFGTEQKILTACAAHTTPDIARLDRPWVARFALRNALVPLDVDDWLEEIVPVTLKIVTINDKIYAIPDRANCVCLFYNKDLFKEAGLDPNKPPRNWNEFVEYGKKLTDSKKGIYGFGMRNSLWWTFPFFSTFGAKFIVDGKCVLDSPEGEAALQLKVDLYRKYKIEAGAWQSGAVDPEMGFQNNKYGMIFDGPWKVKSFQDIGINLGIALIPEGPEGSHTALGGTCMAIFRRSKNKELALDFLKFIVNKENQTAWGNALGQIPVNLKSFAEIDTLKHPYLKVFMEQIKTAIPRPITPDWAAIENTVNPEISAALSGRKTVKEALKAITLKVNKILEEE